MRPARFAAVSTMALVVALHPGQLVDDPSRTVPSALQLHDTASSNRSSSSAASAAALRNKGWTGKGVTVAVIDTGCDATHPDLRDSITHNVEVTSWGAIDRGPRSNTDTLSGHGTHVAGIITGGRGATGRYLGVAPDAEVVCYALGPDVSTAAVVRAYQHLEAHADAWGIDVVNNSWGRDYRLFDPDDTVAAATKRLADQGVVVVFSAGNAGFSSAQLSLSPYAQLPWVIGVAAADGRRGRATFSSNGMVRDNSLPVAPDAGGHSRFVGDRLGEIHPDISAPGLDIRSACAPSGIQLGICDDTGHIRASGTSMAAPAIAGAAAVLLQARPQLIPSQVRSALLATSTPMLDAKGHRLPLWQVGYGHVNLDLAVRLVRSARWASNVASALQMATRSVWQSDPKHAFVSDVWTYQPPLLSLGDLQRRSFTFAVGTTARRLSVALTHPSALLDFSQGVTYTVRIVGPGGGAVSRSTQQYVGESGFLSFTVPVGDPGFGPGDYTATVTAHLQVSDPVDWLTGDPRYVVLAVAQVA